MMSHRGALFALAVHLASAAFEWQFSAQAPKHILFMVVDDLGFADFSYKAETWNITGPLFPTPTMDSLAQAGVKLESMYVHFLCSPSRTALLSGRYAYNIGMQNEVIIDGVPDQLPTNIRTVADLLQSSGYSTAAFGKWDAGMTTWGCTPNCRGFDHWEGFYNADNNYFTHRPGPYLDLRVNFDVDSANGNESGVYETQLITTGVQRWIEGVIGQKGQQATSFAYVAHQAIHGPQQVPPQYIQGGCEAIPQSNPIRRVACGQMRAVDESMANITATYAQLGILQDTLIVVTADNGGNQDTGGLNWPLRGTKATSFEGGMRAAAFISGAGLADQVRGTTSFEFYSLVDWLPTLVHGVAGIDLAEAAVPKYPYQPAPPPLDGMDVWASMSTGSPSPRTEALLNLNTQCWGGAPPGACRIPGMGAYRMNQWKLINGHVAVWASPAGANNVTGAYCGEHDGNVQPATLPVTKATSPPFCPTGWVPPTGSGLHIQPPPDEPTCANGPPCILPDSSPYLSGGVWLFDVVADPYERNNLAAQHPDIVATLMAKLQAINATAVPQAHSPNDPASDPSHFGGVWTPWRGDPVPSHCDPNVTATRDL